MPSETLHPALSFQGNMEVFLPLISMSCMFLSSCLSRQVQLIDRFGKLKHKILYKAPFSLQKQPQLPGPLPKRWRPWCSASQPISSKRSHTICWLLRGITSARPIPPPVAIISVTLGPALRCKVREKVTENHPLYHIGPGFA